MRSLESICPYGLLKEFFRVVRVGSWLGWVFSLGFGSIFLGLPPLERIITVMFAFSLATASIFILNQYFDREEDRENVIKSNLPIASGRIAPRTSLVFSFLLIVFCLVLVTLADMNLLPFFLIYLVLWTAYSAPPFRLKTVPILDFIISGVGAGLLPFLIGVGTSRTLDIRISVVLLSALPLMLAHSSGHILQALGDYEADSKTGVQTFVVKYGREKGILVVGLLSVITGLLPLLYVAFGLIPPGYVLLVFITFPFCLPIAKRYIELLRDPSAKNVVNLQKTVIKYGIIIMLEVTAYVLVLKTLGL